MSAQGLPPRRDEATVAISLEPRRRELAARLAELQWDLGGLVYEMAIRDHVRLEVLMAKAAELQRVDIELGAVEGLIERGDGAGGNCSACGAVYARGAAFCAQCAHPVAGP